MAKATENFGADQRGKKVPLIGYVQDGKAVEQNAKLRAQVPLKFIPDPDADGLTFKLTAKFIDTVPNGRPTSWTGLAKGSNVDHPDDDDNIKISRICGPMRQLDRDTWAIRFYRMGMNNTERSNERPVVHRNLSRQRSVQADCAAGRDAVSSQQCKREGSDDHVCVDRGSACGCEPDHARCDVQRRRNGALLCA
jgi:hypothetical protein